MSTAGLAKKTNKIHKILVGDSKANAPAETKIKDILETAAADLKPTLLRPGNTKLGNKIAVWGVPAVAACPGRTKLCESLCYATKNFYTFKESIHSRHINFAVANRDDFAQLMNADLRKKTKKVSRDIIRIHDSGDMFSEKYTRAWLQVMKDNPNKKFFLFTRSWRVAEILPVLEEMAKLTNVRLWYSIDKQTDFPAHRPPRVRLAYMQVAEDDIPAGRVDLVFRDSKVRGARVKKVGGALVCPYENGITKAGTENVDKAKKDTFSCSTCGMCWDELDGPKDPRQHYSGSTTKGRVSLVVLQPTL